MTPEESLSIVFGHVEQARLASIRKHGPLTGDPVRAAGILTEETGEVMAEALTCTRPGLLPSHREGAKLNMYEEAAQVAAVAINIMINIRRGATDAYTRPPSAEIEPYTDHVKDGVGKPGARHQRGRAKRR